MRTLLAIDPGKHQCACAWFLDGELDRVGFVATFAAIGAPVWDDPDVVVIEKPVIYPRSKTKPRDLLELTAAGYLLAGSFRCPVIEFEPKQWKAQLPKPITHEEAWENMDPNECALFPDDAGRRIAKAVSKGAADGWRKENSADYYGSWDGHNLLDAAALGLVALGQIEFTRESRIIRARHKEILK